MEGEKEIPLEGESMQVQWHEADASPVPTTHPVRTIRVYSNVDGRQLKVMKTADNPEYLDIYLDVL